MKLRIRLGNRWYNTDLRYLEIFRAAGFRRGETLKLVGALD